jgi:hypothetical protein
LLNKDFLKALHGVLVKNGVVAVMESLQEEKSLYGSLRNEEKNPVLEALQKQKTIEFKHSLADFMKFKMQGVSVVLTYAIISGVPLVSLFFHAYCMARISMRDLSYPFLNSVDPFLYVPPWTVEISRHHDNWV